MPSLPRWTGRTVELVRRAGERLAPHMPLPLPSPLRPPLTMALAGLLVLLTASGAMGFALAAGAPPVRPTPHSGPVDVGHLAQPALAQPSATATSRPAPPAATSNGCPITAAETDAERTLLATINAHRVAAGAQPLALNAALSAAADAHTCDMLRHNLMSHIGSDGSTPAHRIQATGLSYGTWGENIGVAAGLGLTGGVARIDGDMMAEPLTAYDHHWNIVYPAFTRVGIGILYTNGQVWLTEDFVA